MADPRPPHAFSGGLRLPGHKEIASREPIVPLVPPPELVLALGQHAGSEAEPAVAVGQHVLKGAPIARAAGAVSAPLHAPTSGTVTAIEARPIAHPSGLPATCMVLEPDGEERWSERRAWPQWRGAPRERLLETIHEAGIAGLGGSGFPTAAKLAANGREPVATLVINAAECEPYVTADEALMRARAPGVVAGVRILAHLLRAETVRIGIEDDKPEAAAALTTALERVDPAPGEPVPELVVMPTRYPSGGEKQLIYTLTGREVPRQGLPTDIGVLCANVATAYAVHRAVEHGEPLISRIVTVTGDAVARPGNVEALLGTPFGHLLEARGVEQARLARLVMGGPMMGFTLSDGAAGVVKTSHCVIAATREEMPPAPPELPCIRCGHCAEVCPQRLLPQQLYWYGRARDLEGAERYDVADCIECGACAYVCPSHIPLVQYFRFAKDALREREADRARAAHARERFERRQARLEAERREREARRRARLAAAGDDRAAKAEVARRAAERRRARARSPDERHATEEANAVREVRRQQVIASDGSVPRRGNG